ncbi:aberrant root formation protein 4 isoform X3 [Arabidopsis lyrata subsp. lyrata]|uniref:aberrant root formation protein 4 isoform X3 n=1 Tax=Arabidopsis lyrata subsp. lyrata TaxID=81972 RepID=UPI000A29B929|nr:aberrant root formation protein 4 isoform X3 [Arabidopsis lyrata subsp. lyrata]|eukprot:XP_020879524.1 aberrant root formation protein 4 isoform X3 [Arabidopsis lyrata subsp. lyrata]
MASASPSRRVRELLALCFSSVEAGGFRELESLVTELVNCLNSLYENVVLNASDELENDVIEVLDEILKVLSSPQVDQDVIDALSFHLPRVTSKFADLSSRCLQLVEEIVDRFVEACNPRDMLSILCEALDAARCSLSPSSCSTPLLHGLSKVFISIQRRHYEQLKVAVPIVLNVLKDISLETDVQVEGLFDKALGIASSIRDVSSKLNNEEEAKVRCLLGLYVIQITAILSVSIRDKAASCIPLVIQLEPFLTYCGLTHLGLITGNDTEKLMSTVAIDDDDDFGTSFPDINLDLLWEFKRHAIEFLLDITEGVTSSHCNDEQIDCSHYTPGIYATLQAVTLVIMYAPDADLRKKTFEALKRVLSDIAAPHRFDVLRALVTNSRSPSMTAILLGLVKDSISESSLQATDCATTDTHVIELVELVLRPPEGGPPLLPDQSDAVLGALNLYRFALLFESRECEAGKERSKVGSEILSKKNLEKAYKEWLLPLRTLMSCSIAENLKEDHGQESSLGDVCLLNPIEFVLYRCIELVEERLKSH